MNHCLSLDAKKEAKVLFPRNENEDSQHTGLHETPLIMLDGARIILPKQGSGIQLKHSGTDRLCIFFSLTKIKNLPKVCELIKNQTGDFEQHIFKLLGDTMIPASDIAFKDDKIAFSTATRSGGAIMPIIIEFQAQ
ncbi:MAG: hypothetical protein U5L45_03810 [Saprospiraceae bacterium]|nr:hypothetical protein [Saprospiraceae bacterium]